VKPSDGLTSQQKPAAFRRAVQTDASDSQTEFGRQAAAALSEFRLRDGSANIDRITDRASIRSSTSDASERTYSRDARLSL
jgi:hypothetical protein